MGWFKKVTRKIERTVKKAVPKPVRKLARSARPLFREGAAILGQLGFGGPLSLAAPKTTASRLLQKVQLTVGGSMLLGPVGGAIGSGLADFDAARTMPAPRFGAAAAEGNEMGLFDGFFSGGGGGFGDVAGILGRAAATYGGRDLRRAAGVFGYGQPEFPMPGASPTASSTGGQEQMVGLGSLGRWAAPIVGRGLGWGLSAMSRPVAQAGFKWMRRAGGWLLTYTVAGIIYDAATNQPIGKVRRMNSLNPQALRRATRRLNGFARFVKGSRKALSRLATAVEPKRRSCAKRKR